VVSVEWTIAIDQQSRKLALDERRIERRGEMPRNFHRAGIPRDMCLQGIGIQSESSESLGNEIGCVFADKEIGAFPILVEDRNRFARSRAMFSLVRHSVRSPRCNLCYVFSNYALLRII